jgi:hypothetical protein
VTVIPDAELPYPEPDGTATSGHAGSDTSRERAVRERDEGITAKRQRYVLERLATVGDYGQTVKDLRDRTNWHHGQASATLSNLHKTGKIECLDDKRDRCHIYVLPENVEGRTTRPPGHVKGKPVEEREFDAYLAGYAAGAGWLVTDLPGETEVNIRVLFDFWRETR